MHRQLWKDSLANANNNNNGVWTEHRNKKRENNGRKLHGKRMSWRIKLMENFTVGRRKLQCSSNFHLSIFLSIVIRKNISPTRITLRTRCGRSFAHYDIVLHIVCQQRSHANRIRMPANRRIFDYIFPSMGKENGKPTSLINWWHSIILMELFSPVLHFNSTCFFSNRNIKIQCMCASAASTESRHKRKWNRIEMLPSHQPFDDENKSN